MFTRSCEDARIAFHVEIRSSGQHARVFNLDADALRARILVPWLAERIIDLGDQIWDPRSSRLTVLEGPTLETPDLAVGQGWSNAQRRRARDVTVSALETVRSEAAATSPERAPAPRSPVGVTVLAARAAQARANALTAELGLAPEPWGAVRARLLAGAAVVTARSSPPVAVLAVLAGEPDATTAFDLGLALGAFGGAVVVTTTAPGAPAAIATVDLREPDAAAVVAERLRLAGALPG